jgi:hypothetical protein
MIKSYGFNSMFKMRIVTPDKHDIEGTEVVHIIPFSVFPKDESPVEVRVALTQPPISQWFYNLTSFSRHFQDINLLINSLGTTRISSPTS